MYGNDYCEIIIILILLHYYNLNKNVKPLNKVIFGELNNNIIFVNL